MIILDIEASGLALESYPIEVAWQHRFNSAKHDSFLIRPERSGFIGTTMQKSISTIFPGSPCKKELMLGKRRSV